MTHKRLRQLAALATTLALLAGLPWLATSLTWPALDLSLATVEVHLRSGRLPEGVGTAILILALWSLWGLYLLVLAAEVLGHLRNRPPRFRLLQPLQLIAASTIGTVAVSPAAVHAAPAPTTASEVPAEPRAEDEPTQDTEEPSLVERSRTIDNFGYDSADLTEQMREDVQAVAELIEQHGSPEISVVVTGHTDAAGDPDYNLDLSQRRAEAVAEELRTHLGEEITVRAQGEGEQALLDSADATEQRRAEISYSVLVTPPTTPDTAPDPDTTDTSDEADDTQGPPVGLSLPNGLILAMTSGALGAAGGFAWGRRQGSTPADHHGAEEGEDKEVEDETAPAESSTVGPPPDDSQKRQELALLDLAHAPGLGITGPGAEGAARTLLSRALEATDNDLTVVIPSPDLRDLLKDVRRLPQLAEDAPIMVTDTAEDALTLLQLQVLARHRVEDEQESSSESTEASDGPQFVVLTRADAAVAAEITSLLSDTDQVPLSAVLLGPWPDGEGATCTIDADGTITHADKPFTDVVGHRWAPATSTDLHQALSHHQSIPTPSEGTTEQNHDHDGAERPSEPTTSPPLSEENVESRPGAVSVTVLGRVTLAVHGQQIRPHRRASYEVLAYLAAHPTGVRLEAAVDAMWPHDAPHRGIRRFHDACTAVRTACRPLLGEDATAVISHDGDLYQLNRDLVACDLWRIEQLLGEAAHGDDAATLVTTAAAMFDDDFAVQTDYMWAEGVRARIRDQLVSALTTCAEDAEPRQAISMLQRAIRIEPTATEAAQELAERYDENADKKSAERVREAHRIALEESELSA